jgi:aspartyl-tRNA(Asn)/glutamyl-tRNA(Gln) amidotransferase subunit C
MSLDSQQVRQVAHLARLQLGEAQAASYAKQLSNILDMVGQLSGVDTQGVPEMAHPLDMTQRLRPDTITEHDRRAEFQAHAPAVADGLYLVPKVIE